MTRGIVWFATPSPYGTCTHSASPVRLAHYGPARVVKGSREAQHVSGQMQSYIRPLREGIVDLRALMKSALPLLNKTSTSRAVSSFRVWGSWSDRSCHQRDYTSHRAGGFLYPLVSTPAPARGFSSRLLHRPHLDSARPTRSAHSCSPRPRLSDSTLAVPATPVSIGYAYRLSSSPSAASPARRG
jgi:hypothetical protein